MSEPRRKHRLTRLGFHFLFVGAFAMLGGALRGFNLLLVLAGLLVGTLIMQWRWSRQAIEAISVQRRLPSEAFAGKPFRVRYRLRNHSRLMPVWMIRIEDKILAIDRGEKAMAVCGAGVVSAKGTVMPHYDCKVTRRGRYQFGPIGLITTFPFSLFSSRQITEDHDEFFVFPELLTLRARWQRGLISRSGGVATTARRSGPTDGEFFGLREWQTGDSPKWIHWRTTARLNDLAVRQFEQQRRFDTCILVDAYCNVDSSQPQEDGATEDADVELAISLAATLLINLVTLPSNRVVLAVAGAASDAVIGGGSAAGKRRMLEMLADVKASNQPRIDEAVKKVLHIVGHTQDLVVISPRSYSSVKDHDSELKQSIAPWLRRGSFRWIDVSSQQVHQWISRNDRGSVTASNTDPTAALTSEAASSSETATEAT